MTLHAPNAPYDHERPSVQDWVLLREKESTQIKTSEALPVRGEGTRPMCVCVCVFPDHACCVSGFVPVHVVSATVDFAPFCVCMHVTVCVCTPDPHDLLHAPQPPATHATGHADWVHVRELAG